jgi:formate-nitrite transporter family protein
MYVVVTGGASWGSYFGGYMVPTLLGNILGGVSLVAVVNHAQVVAGGGKKQEE